MMWLLQMLMHAFVGRALGASDIGLEHLGAACVAVSAAFWVVLHGALLVQRGLLLHWVVCLCSVVRSFSHPCCWLALPPQQSSYVMTALI